MAKQRTVRVEKFRKQLAENVIGQDNTVRVEFGGGPEDYVTIKLPLLLEDGDDFMDRLTEAFEAEDRDREVSLAVLSGHPTRTAEEQLELWLDAGNTHGELSQIYASELNAGRERLGNFRYRP